MIYYSTVQKGLQGLPLGERNEATALLIPQGPLTRILRAIIHNCVFAAYAAALRTRRGTPAVFPFLPINPFPFRARSARRSMFHFSFAVQLRGQGKRNCCHTVNGRALRAPTKRDTTTSPQGGELPSCCFLKMGGRKFGVTHFYARSASRRRGW